MEIKSSIEKTLTETVGDVTVTAKVVDGELEDIDFLRQDLGEIHALYSEDACSFILKNIDRFSEFFKTLSNLITPEDNAGSK